MMLSVLVDSLCIWHRRLGNANMKLIPKGKKELVRRFPQHELCVFSVVKKILNIDNKVHLWLMKEKKSIYIWLDNFMSFLNQSQDQMTK